MTLTAPRLTVIGHCTRTTARILCCADSDASGRSRVARLAWRADGRIGFVEMLLAPAPPYALGVFDLHGLPPGAEVSYAIVVGEDASALPGAEQILHSASGRFRLLPAHRPP